MEINQMRYFMAIVENGSFREAAEKMFVSQPAITKSIQKMEAELGAPLFERKGTKITLTPSGKQLVPYCASILNTLESGITSFKEGIGLKRGHVTIAVSSEIFVKHLIRQFLIAYPEVSLTCYLMSREEMIHALEEGLIDFAVTDHALDGEFLDWQELHSGHLNVLLHKDDPLVGKKEIEISELKDHFFCVGHLSNNLSSDVIDLCHKAHFEPRFRYRGYDPDAAGMLLEIPGSVIISSDAIDAGVASANLTNQDGPAPALLKGTEGQVKIGIMSRADHYQSEAAVAFRKMVEDYFRALP